ncbi:hypothetical protein BCR32DRAFT_269483 [Anaeromyces robustus]|uniref:G-protein coupled receptors family 3 profile domain-containing protein n=1 Tax=Anaeromyces robustus TaxID=1754192 RepID=A0A1Y1X177_9FUNG|nr:hypothetical protein BCR32DRAFT_269483 [Anaeromyces robustus]|eukprot:ORX79452.1 hypothetical protein BCR32DRAFT_269483 [Anaeromyces robustus]
MIKKLKEEIGSDKIFSLDEMTAVGLLMGGNILFLKFWYSTYYNPIFNVTAIPGWKEGVSGSIVGSYNIAINRYINDTNIEAAVEVVKFLTSKETQRDYVIKNKFFSGISELYQEEETCKYIPCEISNYCQPFSIMKYNINSNNDLDSYIEKYRHYVYDYIYNNGSLSTNIKKIDDMTKFYSISIKLNDDSNIGFYFFIIYCILSFIMIISIIYPFMTRFKIHFIHLSNVLWMTTLIGSLIILSSILSLYGEISPVKCKLKGIMITMGFVISISPFIYLLSINFPEENKISNLIYRYKYTFIILIISIDGILSILLYIAPYNVYEVIINEGENFKKCLKYSTYGNIVFYFKIVYEMAIIAIAIILIFLEWNIKKIYYETRILLGTLIIDMVSFAIYNITLFTNINDYISYNGILICTLIIFGFSNYLFTFGIRIISSYIKKEQIEKDIDEFLEDNKDFKEKMRLYSTSTETNHLSSNNSGSKVGSFLPNKILDYHYRSSVSSSTTNGSNINVTNNVYNTFVTENSVTNSTQ